MAVQMNQNACLRTQQEDGKATQATVKTIQGYSGASDELDLLERLPAWHC